MTKTIYVAGPMRGYANHNFPAFDIAANRFYARGWDVVNPAEMDRVAGVDEWTETLPANFLREALRRDLSAICEKCDAIALLRGWQKSVGAAVEVALGKALGLKFYDAETMDEISV